MSTSSSRVCSLIAMAVAVVSWAADGCWAAETPAATLTVQVDKPGGAISPILNGVFFEDINFAADGGLYPERIKNGSFEFDDPMMGWRRNAVVAGGAVGGFGVVSDRPLNANNPHFLRATLEQAGEGLPLTNEGYRGIGVTSGAKFTFSVHARSDPAGAMSLGVELIGANGRPIASAQQLSGFTKDWKKYSCTIESSATDAKAKLTIIARGTGTLDLDMVSLFPQETFNGRPNGQRPDLAQLLKDLRPGFVRFPGGCIVEGRTLSQRYQWKNTIGDVAERKLVMNRWNVEFAPPRNAPDYYESMGLGFFEYFQLCEDIGAKPLPILNCGMACQFNLAELVPLDQLEPYIQDALDLIEFANGPVTSTWGAKRGAMGHSEPFNMTMLGVGNEQWGPQYIARYERFAKAIKAKHPQMILVSGAGPEPADRPIRTRDKWADFQLHLEFATPLPVKGTGQGRGNSGVLINGMYEVQILDCFQNPTYPDGQCGAMYGQTPPLVNASKAPGEWQTYDIIFESPRWDADAKLVKKANVTVIHNGVVLHHRHEYFGATDGINGLPHPSLGLYGKPHAPEMFIELQDHANPVRFRNIWVRKLGEYDKPGEK